MILDNVCWMMDEARLNNAVTLAQTLDFSVFNANSADKADSAKRQFTQQSGYQAKDGIAYITMSGTMMKHPEPCMAMFGEESVSTLAVRKALHLAIKDDSVSAISMIIDSPGGSVNGSFDLASDVRNLKSKKPIYAYASDQMTSAAYLVGSQATKLFANENALIGSVGVMSVLHDTSKAAENAGLKVHVIKTGDEKAIGVAGSEITKDHIEITQRLADTYFGLFKDNIAMSRPMINMKDIQEAQCYLAKDALSKKMIDGIIDLNGLHAIAKGDNNTMAGEEVDLIQISDTTKNSPSKNTAIMPEKNIMSDSLISFLADTKISENDMMMFAKIGMSAYNTAQTQMVHLGVLALNLSEEKLTMLAKGQDYEMLQANIEAYTEIAKAKGLAENSGSRKTVPNTENVLAYGTQQDVSKVASKDLVDAAILTKFTDLTYQAL